MNDRENYDELLRLYNAGGVIRATTVGGALIEIEDLRERYDDICSRVECLEDVLSALLDCPYVVDLATVPNCGVEDAPPYQVVVNMSVAWTKILNARAVLYDKGRDD